MSPLIWKVYNKDRLLVAATVYAEDAALVVSNFALGTVRVDGRIVWREDREGFPASSSVDRATEIMRARRAAHIRERRAAEGVQTA